VVAGKSHESSLIERIFSDDPDEVMPTPKSNRKLTEAQKQRLKQWINEGAKWGKHWAFERIERPKVPANGAKNAIDVFVRAKQAEKGMKLTPRAEPETLLRLVSLDLTGLPPTLEELQESYDKPTTTKAVFAVLASLPPLPKDSPRNR
jgi:transposase